MNKKSNAGQQSMKSIKTTENLDKTLAAAESEKRTKKSGSQSQSNSKRHNNGRGGGK